MSEIGDRPSTRTARELPDSSLASRTRGLRVIVGVAVLAAGAGFLAAQWVKSPAELAARRSPPPASLITAPVEKKVVSATMVTRGMVGSVATVDAVPQQAPPGVARALITRLPIKAGSQVDPGHVVVEISGQPVFFLPGEVPAYRNLGEGDAGPDVAQLHRALRKAGRAVTDPRGSFGPSTAAAVRSLFTSNGYRPLGGGALPMSAVAYVNTDTSTLVVSQAKIGQPAADADLQLASGDLVVFVEAAPAAGDLLRKGAAVTLTAELLGEEATGTISRTPTGPEGRATIAPDRRLDAAWAGQDVRVDLADAGSQDEVLAVPVSAVSLDGGGRATVVVHQGGEEKVVPVTVGTTGDGYVQVTPSGGEKLEAGMRVVVGMR